MRQGKLTEHFPTTHNKMKVDKLRKVYNHKYMAIQKKKKKGSMKVNGVQQSPKTNVGSKLKSPKVKTVTPKKVSRSPGASPMSKNETVTITYDNEKVDVTFVREPGRLEAYKILSHQAFDATANLAYVVAWKGVKAANFVYHEDAVEHFKDLVDDYWKAERLQCLSHFKMEIFPNGDPGLPVPNSDENERSRAIRDDESEIAPPVQLCPIHKDIYGCAGVVRGEHDRPPESEDEILLNQFSEEAENVQPEPVVPSPPRESLRLLFNNPSFVEKILNAGSGSVYLTRQENVDGDCEYKAAKIHFSLPPTMSSPLDNGTHITTPSIIGIAPDGFVHDFTGKGFKLTTKIVFGQPPSPSS